MVTFWTAKIGYFFETEKRNDNFFCFNLFFIIKLPILYFLVFANSTLQRDV